MRVLLQTRSEVAEIGEHPVRADLLGGGVHHGRRKGGGLVDVPVQEMAGGLDSAAEREAANIQALGRLDRQFRVPAGFFRVAEVPEAVRKLCVQLGVVEVEKPWRL